MKLQLRRSWAVVAVVGLAALVGCNQSAPSHGKYSQEWVTFIRGQVESGGGGAGGSSVAKGNPTGWATLRGTFRLSGTAPTMPALDMGQNKDMCAPARAESLVVGPKNGIRDVLVFLNDDIPDDSGEAEPKWTNAVYNLAANAGRAAEELPFAARPQVIFDQKQCRFLSHVFAARTGQSIKIVNSDGFGHNTSLKPQNNAGFDKTIPPGSFDIYTPSAAENRPFSVACAIHPWMSARMIVRENPYFAVTKEDGTFEIRDIPAGVELEFRVWQEQGGNLEDVEVNGKSEPWSKGKLKLKLEPGEERNLDVVVNVSQFTK